MRDVWQTNFWTSAKTIDVHLGWVRKKLGDDTRRPTLITTIRGRGLRFEVTRRCTPTSSPTWLRPRRGVAQVRPSPRRPPDPTLVRARYARRVTAPSTPVLAVIGGGQLARMMAQAAVGLGVPLRLLAEGADVSAAAGGRATPLVGDYRDLDDAARASPRAARSSPSTTSTSRPSTCDALAAEGHACRPGPAALVHAQDKGVMRARLDGLGVPSPRARGRRRRRRGGRVRRDRRRLPGGAQDHPRRLRRQGRLGRRRRGRCADAFTVAAVDRRRDPRRGEGRLPPRAVRAGRPLAVGAGRGLPRRGVRAARRHLLGGDRPGAGPRRRSSPSRPSGSRCGSPPSSTSPASSPSSCSRPATGGCSSTSSRCGRTTPATGAWTAPSPASSRTTSARSSTCRSAHPTARAPWTVMVNILGGEHGALSEDLLRRLPARARPRPAPQGAPLRQGREARAARSATSRPTATTSTTCASAPGTRPRGSAATSERRANEHLTSAARRHRHGVGLRLADDEGGRPRRCEEFDVALRGRRRLGAPDARGDAGLRQATPRAAGSR